MAYMREYIGKGGVSSTDDPQGKDKEPNSSLTYADEDGAINSTIGEIKQHAQIHTTTGQFGGVSRFAYPTYLTDPPQIQPVYVDRRPVERGIKLDVPDFLGRWIRCS